MTPKHNILPASLAIACLAAILPACTDNVPPVQTDEPVEAEARFAASVSNGTARQGLSRAPEDEDDGYVIITKDDWGDRKIYIHDSAKGATQSYVVASGTAGVLTPDKDSEKLTWGTRTTVHTFHGWTQPKGLTMDADGKGGYIDYEKSNRDYEYFIGTERGPVSYQDNGATVDLKFDRLVSRITLGSVTHYTSDNHIITNPFKSIKGISFPSLPRNARFETNIGTTDAPKVTEAENPQYGIKMDGKYEWNGSNALAWHLSDDTWEDSLRLYVSPFKFAEPDGEGNYRSTGLGEFFVVYGDNLTSLNTYNFDLASLAPSITELKAGEAMVINIQMEDEKVTGIFVYIQPWSTTQNFDVPYTEPGIYSQNQFDRLLNGLQQEPPQIPDEFVYDDGEKKVLRLFTDLDYGDAWANIVIPEGYELDGMGFNLKCGSDTTFKGAVSNLYVNGQMLNQP